MHTGRVCKKSEHQHMRRRERQLAELESAHVVARK